MKLERIKLGKNVELQYIPFSELAIPWKIYSESSRPEHDGDDTKQSSVSPYGIRTSKPIDRDQLDALTRSIGQFGLLTPLDVAELPERLNFFYGKSKYFVLNGQRRYLAIVELLELPIDLDERTQTDSLRTHFDSDQITKAEIQAHEQISKLNISDYVLIPCLVYPYTTLLQMVRHSVEGKRLHLKPAKEDLQLAKKMQEDGVTDIRPDDLSKLGQIRRTIDEEKQAIKQTLQQIRNSLKEKQIRDSQTHLDDISDLLLKREETKEEPQTYVKLTLTKHIAHTERVR